jgi:hypothetical protein
MAIVVTNEGENLTLGAILNGTPLGNLTLRLFVNDHTPTDASTAASFTEASGSGYAAKTLTSGSWTVGAGGDPTQATYALQTFTFTGAIGPVFGYYVTNSAGKVVWAERFGASVSPQNNNDTIKVTPNFQAA